MARPIKEGLDYFPHDTDASTDEKIEALRVLYGNNGYAFYFIILERIFRTNNFEIDVSDAETIQILARKVEVTVEEFNKMLKTALKWGCFDKKIYEERKVLTSNGIKKRASVVIEKREEMRVLYHKKVSGVVSDAETQQKPDKAKQSKAKQSTQQDVVCVSPVETVETVDNSSKKKEKLLKKEMLDLISGCFEESFLDGLFKKYPVEKIEKYFEELKDLENIRNPVGWLVTALKNDYQAIKEEGR
jgi:hypothetical protein